MSKSRLDNPSFFVNRVALNVFHIKISRYTWDGDDLSDHRLRTILYLYSLILFIMSIVIESNVGDEPN